MSEQARFSRDEVIDALHLPPEYAEQFWNAFGFARGTGEDSHQFTAEDLAALSVFAAGDHAMDTRAQLAAARSIGQATARLAEWQAEQIRALADDPEMPATTEELIGALSHLQRLVWRRHLDSYLTEPDRDCDRSEVIVGFADIVGYTSKSRSLGMTELESLLESFESAAHNAVVANGGHVVKTLGDAVMFTAPTPAAGAEITIALHELATAGRIPELRIGLAEGEALLRMGDVFGEPANIAARLASSARAGTTLLDEQLADALRDDDRYHLSSIPTLSVRGYRKLKAHKLVRSAHRPD